MRHSNGTRLPYRSTFEGVSDISERFRSVAGAFSERVERVEEADWARPSPCEEWTARDVVTHVVANATTFLALARGESRGVSEVAEEDPASAWAVTRAALQAALEDEQVAKREFVGPMGPSTLEQTMAMFGIGDVLIHTWDLARATGQDERLHPDEVTRLLEAMRPRDAALRQGGRFGPRIDAPAAVDEQTQLLLFTGRQVAGQ